MIGRRCKARERLSRAPLIGRALRDTSNVPPLPTVLKTIASSSAVRPPGRLGRRPAPTQPAPQRPPGAGGHGGRGTPGPIPNPEVKPASADGTAGATLWETRAPPAPGARCAGSGRGGANRASGGGGPERVPPFVCGVSVSRVCAKKKGRRPPRGLAAFSRSGPLARASRVAGGLLHVADPRRAFLAGRGSGWGSPVRCPWRSMSSPSSLRSLCPCSALVGKSPKGDFEASLVTL